MDQNRLNTLVCEYSAVPQVSAVAMGGSQSTGLAGDGSDVDLYLYSIDPLPRTSREPIARRRGTRVEFDNQTWEPGDEWIEQDGTHIDVMFRTTEWMEDQIARVLDRHEASVGYSTCFWANVQNSRVLFDRQGWFTALQARAASPYPEPLRRAIIAKNHRILRDTLSSYRHQIVSAVQRTDSVSVHHRVTALLASYFDVLFAVNRVPHPGEKRLFLWVGLRCPKRPPHCSEQIGGILSASAECSPVLLERIDAMLDGLDALLAAEGLLPLDAGAPHPL